MSKKVEAGMSGKELILISQLATSNDERNLRSQFVTIENKHGKQRQHRQYFNPPKFDGFRNQAERLTRLNRIAIQQTKILVGDRTTGKLEVG